MAQPRDAARAQVLREFEQRLAGLDLGELRQLTQSLLLFGAESAQAQLAQGALRRAHRPDPRRPRRDTEVTLRVRADLRDTKPPVWRRLDVSSSLMLDELHTVLQAAFGFTDSHLHRFAVGESVFDDASAVYLCPYDVEDGDTDGVDERDVGVDELLVTPGDRLLYVYDYGDGWRLTLKLEKVLDRGEGEPPARCVAGRRSGPPEDCGGPWGFEELVASGEWDLEFDLASTDDDVQHALVRGRGLPPLVAELVAAVPPGEVADQVYVLAFQAELDAVPPVDADTAARAVERYRWLIERLGADGARLTAAGYLPPLLVKTIMSELRLDPDWIGTATREDVTRPVADFRRSAQLLGIVSKTKGQVTVPAGVRRLAGDPLTLWGHIVGRLPLGREGSIDRHASLLALLWTAAGRSVHSSEFGQFAGRVLTEAGWRAGGQPLDTWHVWRLLDDVRSVLEAMSSFEPRRSGSIDQPVTADGVLLARTVLARTSSGPAR